VLLTKVRTECVTVVRGP